MREGFHTIEVNGSMLVKAGLDQFKSVASRTLFDERRVYFIDEGDGISMPAQMGLRSIIEPKGNASWVMTCNYRKKILEPLASRFMQIECSLPETNRKDQHVDGIIRRCKQILEAENVQSDDEQAIKRIVLAKYPDIRQTIIDLQLNFQPALAA